MTLIWGFRLIPLRQHILYDQDCIPFGADILTGDDIVDIPRYKVSASAGNGVYAQEKDIHKYLGFNSAFIRSRLHASTENLFVMDVKGDSMEPTLRDGEVILIDRQRNHMKNDGMYVFRIDNDLIVKRVERRIDGSVLIKSDNPLYDTFTLHPGEQESVDVIGRVVWHGGEFI